MVTERSTGDRSTGFKDLFEAYLLELGATVVRTPVTKITDNITGDEDLTYVSGTESIVVSFKRQFQNWSFDKEGRIEGGDAKMLCASGQTIVVNDKITYQGETFKVQNIIERYVADAKNYKDVNLFLV